MEVIKEKKEESYDDISKNPKKYPSHNLSYFIISRILSDKITTC